MRSCDLSERLRAALIAEVPIGDDLASHVASCDECSGIHAEARRFLARLDAATADLVTDMLPPNTPAVARGVRGVARRRASPGVLLGALVSATLVAFAAVGVIVTGASVADSLRNTSGSGQGASTGGLEPVECYLGEPAVEVTSEGTGSSGPEAVIAYCFPAPDANEVDRSRAIACAVSVEAQRAARRDAEAYEPSRPTQIAPTYLGACTRGVDVEVEDLDGDDAQSSGMGPSHPLITWDQADAATDWPVLRPGWLPDGYELAALQGFRSADGTAAIETIVATYLHAGTALTVEQFRLPEPDGFRVELSIPGEQLHQVSTGQTTVGRNPGFWADGVVATAGGPGFDASSLVLTWADDGIGYRISSRFDDLETLRRIGDSLAGG